MTIIEVRPFLNGWQVYEAPGVQPVFLSKEQAVDYAECSPSFRSGEIRVLDSSGAIELLDHNARSSAGDGVVTVRWLRPCPPL